MNSKVNWELVNALVQSDDNVSISRLYGYPELLNPLESVFAPGVELQPKWEIPNEVAICTAITGAMNSRKSNPNQPVTVEQIREEAMECCEAGAANVHIHVRDDNEINAMDLDRFHQVIDPIHEKYPDVLVCGCAVPFVPGEFEKMEQLLKEGLFDQTPVNTVASYLSDTLFCKPPHVMIKKAEICEKYGVKPQIAIYSDGDIDNARRYLINTGVLSKPYYWILLPGLVGCSPMYSSLSMIDTLMGYVRRIREIDAGSQIMVVSGGRASSHITALSLLMGLDVRVGKEDTIWRYPHKDEMIRRNVDVYRETVQMARLLGREPATPSEYVKKFGLKRQGGKRIG
ncbi:3-keto-5-aminohexanoate cleavage protein [Papillibacter cinnamivorans]|uniref:3-keto-5-aminohexanoate cleavage enzyme n=1 Tax=Papillibacter cinnamivorans DSM 12816 TaxID=1122930 RepID=A0A1W2C275_9FIRM|nr:3-keto-5-aminohexanoate cleavage protein [Papillibacter cinnamivorans]SMC79335.1 3-keto-5-aminohexanoate cleavage enzyme [Papillibacter cinnamivorans DSM 12816]